MSQTQTPAGSPIGKPADEFRNYDAEARDTVKEFYRLNHTHQTLDFVLDKKREYLGLNRKRMKVWEALEYLDSAGVTELAVFDGRERKMEALG